jgi:hypothetical protein
MPNAIKYKTGNLSGSLDKGTVALGTNVLGPTSNTGWYSGITPDSGRYVVYKTSLTNTPRIFYPANDNELIRLAKQEGATGADTGSVANVLSWMASQTNLLAVNKSYPDIIDDNLVYLIDSTFTPSYPTTGTTTYPLDDIANVGNGTLQNGVGWDSNSRAFIFDGSDDQIPLAISDNFQNIDFSTGFTLMVLYKIDAVTDFNGQFRCMIGVTGGNRTWNYYLYGPSNPATTLLYHFSGQMSNGLSSAVTVTSDTYHLGAFTIVPGTTVGTYYHDGTVISTQTAASSPSYTTAGGTQYIGRGDNMWKGNIAKVMIYNKALSQEEIYQTYYQGNIVTNGLVLALDAGNLISYIGNGTTAYSLTGSMNGTLTNGTSYSNANGGTWVFDGVDDFINLPIDSAFNTPSITVEVWANLQTINDRHILYVNWQGNSLEVNSDRSVTMYNYNSQGQQGASTSAGVFNWDNWAHFVGVYDDTNQILKTYVNGVLLGSRTNTASTIYSVGVHKISGTDYGGEVKGNIAIVRHYNRALSDSEVKQNFSAQSSRFL